MKYAVGAVTAAVTSCVAFGLAAAPAHADAVDDYVYQQGPSVVCDRLDRAGTVTLPVLKAMGSYIKGQGFSAHEAAGIVWDSVTMWCPQYELAVSAVAQNG